MEKKEKIEEFEEFIKKSVKELKGILEENEEKIKKQPLGGIFFFISSLPLPEISPSLLEKTSNKFLKEFDWKKFEKKEYLASYLLGLFISAFLKKIIEDYVLLQKEKGIKEEDIKPIEVHLKVKEAPIIFKELGFQNPKKLHLIIEGDCTGRNGYKMQGGKVIIKGSCGYETGCEMHDGEVIVEGNCAYQTGRKMKNGKIIVKGDCGNFTGQKMQGGEIIIERNCEDWTGDEMRDGSIIIKGNCGDYTGVHMQGGELNIKGEVVSFDKSAFSSNNQGTIIWKRTKIWEKGNWTKQGMKMRVRGEIPMRRVC